MTATDPFCLSSLTFPFAAAPVPPLAAPTPDADLAAAPAAPPPWHADMLRYVPMYFDTTNLFLYFYTGGAWKKSTVYA
jgi:hypothetical protein